MLRGGYHDNQYLQRSWKKYGEDVFVFEILQECPIDELITIEKHWVAQMRSNQRCYGFNIGDCVVSPMKGRRHSEATKQLLSKMFKGPNSPNYGTHLAKDVRKQITRLLSRTHLKSYIIPIGLLLVTYRNG